MTKNLKKNLKKFYKKNTTLVVVVLLALVIGVPIVAYNSFDDRVIDRIADKYLEGVKEIAIGAITLDKTTFDHGIEIFSGLDVTGTVDMTGALTVRGKFNDGGSILNASTTLTSARVLTAEEVCNSSIITVNSAAIEGVTMSAASLDITLPATTTLFALCLEEEGAHTSFLFVNLSPAAATTTQIVAGTGMDLLEPDTSSDHGVDIAGAGGRALIEIWRHTGASTTEPFDAYVTVTEYSPAD